MWIRTEVDMTPPDVVVWSRQYETRQSCLDHMINQSLSLQAPHCEPQWERYTNLCWGPTPAGHTSKLPCPDDGFLNPKQFASRTCLPNASWYVNYSFSDQPYTDFTDCLIPELSTAEEDLRKIVGEKILLVLKALDASERFHLTLHVISIALLVATIITCGIMLLKLHSQRKDPYKYTVLIVGAAALLLNNGVTLSSSSVNDAWQRSKCRTAKYLVIFSSLVLYECLLGYVFLCIAAILKYVLRPLWVRLVMLSAPLFAGLLVAGEIAVEVLHYPDQYCGFGTLQTSYHWITTGPKMLLVLCIICLDIVCIYGSFYLKQPHLKKGGALRNIRQHGVSAMTVTLYNLTREVLLVLVYGVAYLNYFDSPIDFYVRIFSVINAAQGIVYSLLMCFCDLETMSHLPCANQRHYQQSNGSQTRHYSFISGPARCPEAIQQDLGTDLKNELTRADSEMSMDYMYRASFKRTASEPKFDETKVVFVAH